MHIRRATSHDLEKLLPLFNAYREFYRQPRDEQQAKAFLNQNLEMNFSVIFIMVDENNYDEFIGFMTLNPGRCSVKAENYWILYDLFVNSNYRNRGVATALLHEAENFAINSGAGRIELQTAHNNKQARHLYEQAGYKEEKEFLTYARSLGKEKYTNEKNG